MAVRVKEVTTRSDCREFVQLQFDLYKNNKFWVPPFRAEEMQLLKPGEQPFSRFFDSRFWLAYKDGKCVGRIGAIIHEKYNEKKGERLARFTRLEFQNNPEIVESLLSTAEQWALEKKMEGIIGPLGFSNLDLQGLLIEGFDYLPSIASPYHHDYYYPYLEKAGYRKEIDWVEFRLTVGKTAVEKANRGAQLVQKRYGIKTLHFTESRQLLTYADSIFRILSDSFSDLPFVSSFDEDMIRYYSKKYIRLLDPQFVKIVTLQDEPIGFIIGLPSLSKALQKAKGRHFPLGLYHLLGSGKKVDTLDQLLTGVTKQQQATGAGVILMAELQNVMLAKGMKYIETTGIFETNQAAIGNWKNYEHVQHKRRRCYRKMF